MVTLRYLKWLREIFLNQKIQIDHFRELLVTTLGNFTLIKNLQKNMFLKNLLLTINPRPHPIQRNISYFM